MMPCTQNLEGLLMRIAAERESLKSERASLGEERAAFRAEIGRAAAEGPLKAGPHEAAPVGSCPMGYGPAVEAASTASAASSGSCPRLGARGKGMYYGTYLQLDTLLSAQAMESELHGCPVHDEMLFIVAHQTYELWFKQILFELRSVRDIFLQGKVLERSMLSVCSRLERVVEIQKVLVSQFRVLETMTALDFRDFRDYLTPASGFQSVQFRTLEALLGLRPEARVQRPDELESHFSARDMDRLRAAHAEGPSLLDALARWLERTPGVQGAGGFDFWPRYREVVEEELAERRREAEDPRHAPEIRERLLEDICRSESHAASIFDVARHDELVAKGRRHVSNKALQGAIMITLFRDEPKFHNPFRILTLLTDIDELMTQWRCKHMMLVHRTVGSQGGTGGSSGYQYLKATTSERYRVFSDIGNLSTYLVASHRIPQLDAQFRAMLDFSSSADKELGG